MNEAGNNLNICAECVPVVGVDRPGYVYFISDGEFIKIGFSGAPQTRLSDLQGASARTLTLLGMMPSTESGERETHQKFSHLRTRGEWFQDKTGEIAEFIANIKPLRPKNYDVEQARADLAALHAETMVGMPESAGALGRRRIILKHAVINSLIRNFTPANVDWARDRIKMLDVIPDERAIS